MKTIKEHNDEIFRLREEANRNNTGVECPLCHAELYYADPWIRASSPPQRQVKCLGCNYIDYIYI